MKNYLLILTLGIGVFLNAQITINYSDYPEIGDVIMYDTTNVGGLTVGASGANAVWDFSSMPGTYNVTRTYTNPSTSTYAALFPSANMVIQMPGAETFLNVNNNRVEILGTADDHLGLGFITPAVYTPTLTSIVFPTNYQDSRTDVFGYNVTANGAAYGVDSVSVDVNGTVNSSIDGYGTLILPNPFLNSIACLREHAAISLNFDISVYTLFTGWMPLSTQTESFDLYTWVALGYGSGILETQADGAGNVSTVLLAEYTNSIVSVNEGKETYLKVRTDINNSFAAIEWNPNKNAESISVFDNMGRLIKSVKPLNSGYFILTLSEYTSGQYIVSVAFDNETISKPLMIQ